MVVKKWGENHGKAYSDSDENAGRTANPGSRPQRPAKTSEIKMNGESYGKVTMNYGGVAGGNPTTDTAALKGRAKLYDSGKLQSKKGPASAAAARKRVKNIGGHNAATQATHQKILKAKKKK